MRDRDEIVRVAKALAAELEELTDEDHVELLLQRLHDAKRGSPPAARHPWPSTTSTRTATPPPAQPATATALASSPPTTPATWPTATDATSPGLVDQMWQIRKRVGVLRERYGAIHPNHQCVECRAGRWQHPSRPRSLQGPVPLPRRRPPRQRRTRHTDRHHRGPPVRVPDRRADHPQPDPHPRRGRQRHGRTVAWKRRRKAKGNAA